MDVGRAVITSLTVVPAIRASSSLSRFAFAIRVPVGAPVETRRFESRRPGHTEYMEASRQSPSAADAGSGRPTLVFVSRRHCGASRRMESLVAWIKVTQKKRLRVVDLDADRRPELASHLGVRTTPTLVVLEEGEIVGRLEGRATGRQIDDLIRPHLSEESDDSGHRST
jgi:hypothetical protein